MTEPKSIILKVFRDGTRRWLVGSYGIMKMPNKPFYTYLRGYEASNDRTYMYEDYLDSLP